MTASTQELHAAIRRVVQGLADEYNLYVVGIQIDWRTETMIGSRPKLLLEDIEITTKTTG